MTTEHETTFTMTEAQMKQLARNSLMVAGHEMGEEGDHWPVIKSTITEIMHDWEKLENERAVQAEMRKHLYAQLKEMEAKLPTCSAEERKIAAPILAELREIYDAFFESVQQEELYLAEDTDLIFEDIEKPLHIRRAEAILETLTEEQDG